MAVTHGDVKVSLYVSTGDTLAKLILYYVFELIWNKWCPDTF